MEYYFEDSWSQILSSCLIQKWEKKDHQVDQVFY